MIANIRGRGEIDLRAFALTDMVRYGYGGLRNIGGGTSEKDARGIPALHRAARIRSEALASVHLHCWAGEGPLRERKDGTWQSRLFRARANEDQTRFVFWETVGESLAYRNNAYIWKNVDPLSERIVDWWALHPDQVTCKGRGQYRVKVMEGYLDPVGHGHAAYEVDESTILHVRGHGQGGTYEAPTPIEVFKEALAAPVERQRHESRMWRRGTSLQVALSFPKEMTFDQAQQWREGWRATYEGSEGETTAVVGGGATITPIGMSASDAMFVEMAHLTVEDASRIMGVPANLLGAPTQTGKTKATLEEDLMTWLRFGFGPDLERLESALGSDEQLFGTSVYPSAPYPAFDTEGFVRGDISTEASVLLARVQAGILTPDEARQILGYPPHPEGVGAIPQITPVGGAPNPALQGGMAPPEPVLDGKPT